MTVRSSTRRAPAARWVPFALVALSVVPVVTGTMRVVEVFGGPHLMPPNPRVDASPAPMVVHILSVIPFALLGAFQFSDRLRRGRPGWHIGAGRVLVALGLAAALSGLWMTVIYPRQAGTGWLLFAFRLMAASGLGSCLVLGLAAVRGGDVARHRAWMTRAYALALGAGTQVLTGAFRSAFLGGGVLPNDLSMGAAWAINLVVAEYVIRGGGLRTGRLTLAAAGAGSHS
jgi:uncharacterized membrane protein